MKGYLWIVMLIVCMSIAHAVIVDCNSCADCNTKILTLNSSDTIRLTTHINAAGDCINLQGVDNFTFDCNGYNITCSFAEKEKSPIKGLVRGAVDF